MTVAGLCDCYNQYGMAQLDHSYHALLQKLEKKNVQTLADMLQVLTKSEMEQLRKTIDKLDATGTPFERCTNEVEKKISEYEEEDDYEKEFMAAFQVHPNCKHFYYIYLAYISE